MNSPTPLRNLPQSNIFRPGDVFVLFGELFGRGYANGLVNAARNAGMDIIGITVGRRADDSALRPLTDEELAAAEANLGGRIINVPLMAGFDLDAPPGEPTPTDMLGSMTLKNWTEARLDWAHVEKCRNIGVRRFVDSVGEVMARLEPMIADGRNVFFAHTMAGGILKAKVFLAIANRVYKGSGERFMSSNQLLDSDLGKLSLQNFDEVTANSFLHLIEGSAAIRARMEASGGQVRYSAYGYHGTEILIDGSYQWQTYTNYTQGHAKMRLERIARSAWAEGIKATVYNCPEIRTNSSDIFVGVELPLIALLLALQKEDGGPWADRQWRICGELLLEGCSLEDVLKKINDFNGSDIARSFRDFAAWPMPNTAALADIMIGTSEAITKMHKDRKSLVTDHLSSLVLEAAGPLMFDESSNPGGPVLWLNHDIIARKLNRMHPRTLLAENNQMKTTPIPILGLAHIGIRVHDLERSVRFYELLGFTKTAGPLGPEPVAVLDHPSGVEVNLVLNAPNADEPNILMDVPGKHPGITHFALLCPDIMAAKAQLEAAGIALSGGPIRFGPGAQGIFVRDPDRNVIELHQRG